MKSIIKNGLVTLIGCILALTGCNSDPEYYSLPVPADQMKLAISSPSLQLSRSKADEVAARFTWNEATDRGDGEIVYLFRLYRTADKENTATQTIEVAKDKRTFEMTNRELNDIISSWGILPGEEADITAEVIAKVVDSKIYHKPELTLCDFKATGYNASAVYLIIEEEGESLRGIPITESDTQDVFMWKGILPSCQFRISDNDVTGWPAYMKGETQGNVTALISVDSPEQGGEYFVCEQESAFEITVDLNQMTYNASIIPIYRLNMTLVKEDGTQSTIALEDQEIGSDWFYWEGKLEANTIISFARNDESPALTFALDGSDRISEVEGSAGLYKVSETQTYVISILPGGPKLVFKHVWWLGECAPVGDVLANIGDWDIQAAYLTESNHFKRTDLRNNPHMYYLTTQFKSGGAEGFKIATAAGFWNEFVPKDWNGINPFSEGPSSGWTHVGQRGVSNWWSFENDWKWHPHYDGNATIEFDVSAMKLRMVK